MARGQPGTAVDVVSARRVPGAGKNSERLGSSRSIGPEDPGRRRIRRALVGGARPKRGPESGFAVPEEAGQPRCKRPARSAHFCGEDGTMRIVPFPPPTTAEAATLADTAAGRVARREGKGRVVYSGLLVWP
jgi:hypothetical protein